MGNCDRSVGIRSIQHSGRDLLRYSNGTGALPHVHRLLPNNPRSTHRRIAHDVRWRPCEDGSAIIPDVGACLAEALARRNALSLRHFLIRLYKFVCYIARSMAIQKKNAFSRRLPDLVTEELVAVLSQRKSFKFKQLFEIVHENLRQRNAASGGEEMLRLRAYEKLQNLVARGVVKKTGKSYKGDSSALAAMVAANTAQAAAVASKS